MTSAGAIGKPAATGHEEPVWPASEEGADICSTAVVSAPTISYVYQAFGGRIFDAPEARP